MPKDKDLKRLIRARMARTGESYTTARARLVEARDLPPLPDDYASLAGMSDDAVRNATGRSWPEWTRELDRIGAHSLPHAEIAARVAAYPDVSPWWSQAVTVAYERFRGLRAPGQRRDGTFDVNKSVTVPVGIGRLWAAVHDPAARKRWLPDLDLEISTASEPTSFRARLADDTRLDAHLVRKGPDKTTVTFQHRKLPDREAADERRRFWTARVAKLKSVLAEG